MTPPEPIIVSATVLAQMFLYLDSLRVDINAFLRSLGIEPQTVRFSQRDNSMTLDMSLGMR